MLSRERTVQAYLDKADSFSFVNQVIDNLFDCFTGRTHGNDDSFRIRIAYIIKQPIFATGQVLDLFHTLRDNGRNPLIIGIGHFYTLKINVRILGGSP